jgi:hypothetical protein
LATAPAAIEGFDFGGGEVAFLYGDQHVCHDGFVSCDRASGIKSQSCGLVLWDAPARRKGSREETQNRPVALQEEIGNRVRSRLKEGDGLDAGDIETLAATDILAADEVVGPDHVALRLGEAGAVALVGSTGELGLLAADEPPDLVFPWLAAVRTGHGVGPLFGALVEKVTFFHAGVPPGIAAADSARESWQCSCEQKYMASSIPAVIASNLG